MIYGFVNYFDYFLLTRYKTIKKIDVLQFFNLFFSFFRIFNVSKKELYIVSTLTKVLTLFINLSC